MNAKELCERAREKCAEALRDDEAATKGPLAVRVSRSGRYDQINDCALIDCDGKIIAECFALVGHGDARPAGENATVFANARTREPAIAKLLLKALEVVEAARDIRETWGTRSPDSQALLAALSEFDRAAEGMEKP